MAAKHRAPLARGAAAVWFLLCSNVFAVCLGQPSALDELIQREEDVVREIAQVASDMYARRSTLLSSCTPSVHACSNNFPEDFQCTDKIEKDRDVCGGCEVNERKVRVEF